MTWRHKLIQVVAVTGAIASILAAVDVYLIKTGFLGHQLVLPIWAVAIIGSTFAVALFLYGHGFRELQEKLPAQLIAADAGTILRFVEDESILQNANKIDLWLYTAETLLGPWRALLEGHSKPIKIRLIVRRPEFDMNKRDVAEGALRTARENSHVNNNVKLDIHFYNNEPLNRLQVFYLENRTVGLAGIYRYDAAHPMCFIGAEQNRMMFLDSEKEYDGQLLNSYISRFSYLWDSTLAIRAILFDLDGVLVDSMEQHVESWFKALESDIPSVDTTRFRKHVYDLEGLGATKTVIELCTRYNGTAPDQTTLKAILGRKREAHKNILSDVIPFSGIKKLLRDLKEYGVPLGVVSGSEKQSLSTTIANHFPGIFDVMVSGDDVNEGKPSPEPYLKALQLLHVDNKKNCMAIENSPLGITSAKDSGVRAFGLLRNSPLGADALLSCGAERVFVSPTDLMDAFRKSKFT